MSKRKGLYAGAAESDITPAMGIHMAGDIGSWRPVEEIRERIYARALVLESGSTRFCIVTAELCYITDPNVAEIRKRASKLTGIPAGAIMIHPHQNHAAPCIGNAAFDDSYAAIPDDLWWLRSSDPRYTEPGISGIVDAIVRAAANMKPVTVSVGREIDGRVAFNRRFIMRDGTGRGHPPPHERKQILQPEGPVDPEVGVMLLTGENGRHVAALLHHTCHPVSGYPNRYIIGDWPGNWASAMRAALGNECVPLVINGCCGNIHHNNHMDPTYANNPVLMGERLTESAMVAIRGMEKQASTNLSWASEVMRIPFRPLPKDGIKAAKALLKKNPDPMLVNGSRESIHWDWVYAHSMLDLEQRWNKQPYYDYEVQAVRIADFGLVALVGEPFVEGQLKVKMESPFPYTFLAHMANGYAGYLPTPAAIVRGGFETRTANWSKLEPEALDNVANKSLELLRKLHKET